MKILYDPEFINELKKSDIRIRKSFREKIVLFQNNPYNPVLDNHSLKRQYQGYSSINITADYRAIFKELHEGEGAIYYFFVFGTHKKLYRP